MREQGCPEGDLFSFLSSQREKDLGYRNILSSMCTPPHPVAARAHAMFLETNLGDPGLFPGTAELEELLVRRLGALMHHPKAGGYATSGGTESNIQAFRIAKKQKPVEFPNVVVPASSHFSFQKACDILGLEIRTAPLDARFRVDAEAVEALVDRNTVCIVGIAGTTEYGVVAGCMENTRRLIEGMETLGYERAVTPDVNVATFSCGRAPEGWRVSTTRAGHMRIVCMPHVTRDVIEAFLGDMSDMHA